ncbi:Anaphase-promoting complex, cyclosome, subunit 4 domain containing protein [Naviculisporaceae sp. PSN 640]
MAPQDGNLLLPLLNKGTFTPPVSGRHFTLNPVISLTATVGDGNVLYIWRPNDELVSKYSERQQTVSAIRWKEDGQFLAAGWSDGFVRLVGLESSKAVHHIRVGNGSSTSKTEFIAWSRNVTKKPPAQLRFPDRLVSQGGLLDEQKDVLDLPHDLEFVEIETALPKLSPLPVAGGTGDDMFVFSTTSSLDFVFRPIKPEEANTVDVMTVGTADGGIHLSIYDSFIIGSFKPSPAPSGMTVPAQGPFHLCGHGSHPDISTHSLLLRPQDGDGKCLYLVPMDLTFIHDSPVNLSVLASKTTTLQNLLRYLKQTLCHMAGEFKSSRELPTRFMLGVQEDLEKFSRGPVTIVQALCHTVMTGDVFPPMREWLLESLAERGHKRWDKAVVSGLANLRALVHENFIPALERCGVVLSRLLGIARFHEGRESIGFTVVQIKGLMDIISCLNVIARNILSNVMDELEHFGVFSVWLRMEIDRLVSPSLADELTEKEATMDHAKVVTYIQRYLTSSPLALYFDELAKDDPSRNTGLPQTGSSLLDLLDKQIKRHESGQTYNKALPNVAFLVDHLTSSASSVFSGIAEAERRGVRFGQATEISVGETIWKHDIHACALQPKGSEHPSMLTFTAVVSESDKSKISVFRTSGPIINGISSDVHLDTAVLKLPDEGTIIDLKFLDDSSLLVLCRQKESATPVLLRADYQSGKVKYSTSQRRSTAVSDRIWTTVGFSDMTGFVPVQMEVQKASNLRDWIPARVCLLGRDNAAYRTYQLPVDWDAVKG